MVYKYQWKYQQKNWTTIEKCRERLLGETETHWKGSNEVKFLAPLKMKRPGIRLPHLRINEILYLHLLELTGAEEKLPPGAIFLLVPLPERRCIFGGMVRL